MKDRIIFWMDSDLSDFGLANSLQELHDCDLYAVIDIPNRSKKFFQEQELVHFKKIWFYHDHILRERKKPDISYLKSFEDKCKINLWLIAYNERIFNQYNEYYKFSTDEILSILERECKLFETILDEVKPDFLITRLTDLHQNHLFYELCKVKGVKVMMRSLSRLGYRTIISQEADKADFFEFKRDSSQTKRTFQELEDYLKRYNYFKQVNEYKNKFQSSQWQKYKAALQFFIIGKNTNYKTHYTYYGRTKFKVLIKEIIYLVKKKYREFFINRNLSREVNDEIPFVYLPLHVEPERILLIGAPFYINQLEVIKNTAKSLPMGYNLVIKEHPLMNTRGWRNVSYYKEIMALPNVKLLHPSVKPEEITKKSSLVISVAGTSGLEAAFYGKPSIIFADMEYSVLPSVHKLKSLDELPQAIRSSLTKKVDLSDLNSYVDMIEKNSFEFDYGRLITDYLNYFYYGGFLQDIEIPISKMKSFLEEYKVIYEQLAMEYLKKIKQFKDLEANKNVSEN